MKYIISGTDRPHSNTSKTARYIQDVYLQNNETVEIIDLEKINPIKLMQGSLYGGNLPPEIQSINEKILNSEGLIIITPEYNGSMPGVLKWFIDHLPFPQAFEFRPVCFVGLGGMFGGLRPVEHLQQVFGYRNAFIYPERIFLMNVAQQLKPIDSNPSFFQPSDPRIAQLIEKQARGFQKFCAALKSHQLDASSVLK